MENKKNRVEYRGELTLEDGITIPCYVLSDGRRVLSGRKMQEALRMVDESGQKASGTRMGVFLSRKSLNPFISKYLDRGTLEPIICYDGKQRIHGYEASVLVDICDVFLEARKYIELTPRQEIIARRCEILIRSFAKTGIIALVDEATGYQFDRERDELQKILKAYIAEELQPWQKRFPDVFYQELFRLNGWDFTVKGIKKRPQVIGKWTTTLVYDRLPKGVLEELKARTPKTQKGEYSARLHQSLTLDVGEPTLTAQINKVIAIFQVSDNMRDMWQKFEKMKLREEGQLDLPFEFDDDGYTKS